MKKKKTKQPTILRDVEIGEFIRKLKNSKTFYFEHGKYQIKKLSNEFSKY